jgi:hypothetical protein
MRWAEYVESMNGEKCMNILRTGGKKRHHFGCLDVQWRLLLVEV